MQLKDRLSPLSFFFIGTVFPFPMLGEGGAGSRREATMDRCHG